MSKEGIEKAVQELNEFRESKGWLSSDLLLYAFGVHIANYGLGIGIKNGEQTFNYLEAKESEEFLLKARSKLDNDNSM